MTRSDNSRRGSAQGAHGGLLKRDLQVRAGQSRAVRYDMWDQVDCGAYSDNEDASLFDDSDDDNEVDIQWVALQDTQLTDPPESREWSAADCSDVASEWSVVTSAESSWVVEWHDSIMPPSAIALASWPEETACDFDIAATLQHDERISSGIARFRLSRRAVGARELMRVPVDGLMARLGNCVVCSENVATVLMEPCGHLALCGACSESWTRSTCVICRCPSKALNLLSGVTPHPCGSVSVSLAVKRSPSSGEIGIRLWLGLRALPHASVGVNVRVADGLVSIPSIETGIERLADRANRTTKLDLRRRMRQADRQRRQASGVGNPLMAGGVHGKRAWQAEKDAAWERYYEHCARWRCLRNRCRAALCEQPQAWRGRVSELHALIKQANAARPGFDRRRFRPCLWDAAFEHVGMSGHHCRHQGASAASQFARKRNSAHAKAREAKREWDEERRIIRQERQELKAEAHAAATEVVTVAARMVEGPLECAACGEAEACMMHLPCRHVALCQHCFDATWQAHAPCARCGTASHVTLCVRRA